MTMPGSGCFVGLYDLALGQESDHDHWHTLEHMIERVAIPGFLRGSRYRSLTGSPRVCVMYQAAELSTLNSPAYLERLNDPTLWTSRTLPHFTGMNRTMCTVASTHGHGTGGYLLTIQLSPKADKTGDLMNWLSSTMLPKLAARGGLCAAHLLLGDKGVSTTPTKEKDLRPRADIVADWVLLVEGYDREAVTQAKAELLGRDGLYAHGVAGEPVSGLYSLDFTLGEDEATAVWRHPSTG